jgi:signal transduction histidine kinase
MIFQRISYRIALQFTAFVFVLLLINGMAFLIADIGNARQQLHFKMVRDSATVQSQVGLPADVFSRSIPPHLRQRVRVLSLNGNPVYIGNVFDDVPLNITEGFTSIFLEKEPYEILTLPIIRNGGPIGFVQVADLQRFQMAQLPERAMIYLLVSVAISALTFFVGVAFARRSLKPAVEMVERLEQFTQDASHELRTPLAALGSSLDVALKTGKHREGLLSAKDDLKEVSALVERLLELARLDKLVLHRERINVSLLVEQSIEKYRQLAQEKNVTIESIVAPEISVQGDAALLKQVLSNLLGNAIKFSKSEGGTITVRLTKKELSIADTGIGIRTEALPHIFNRFYQADASRSNEGYGLGLALVKRIVELHGWRIEAKSKSGSGTLFAIALTQS